MTTKLGNPLKPNARIVLRSGSNATGREIWRRCANARTRSGVSPPLFVPTRTNSISRLVRFDAARPPFGFRHERLLRVSSSQKRVAVYAIGSQCNRNRVRDLSGNCTGVSWRIRFDFALAEHWTLPRWTDTRDLRCAVAAKCFLHGAGERWRF